VSDVLELVYNNDVGNTILNAVKAIDLEGREYDILQDKISTLLRLKPKKIITKKALIGEINILKGIAEEVIFSNNTQIKFEVLEKFFEYKRNEKILQLGYKILNTGVYIGYNTDKEGVVGIFPFPFRDDSFDEIIIFEILDYEITREVHRVLKKGKRVYLIVRDIIKDGVNPIQAIKVLSYKFEVSKIFERAGFWIIEGIKKK